MGLQIAYEQLTRSQKLFLYMDTRRLICERGAIFSDETKMYRTPLEPTSTDKVQIRIRAGKGNVDAIHIVYNNQYKTMNIEKSEGRFDYYTVELPASSKHTHYYFELHSGNLKCYYNKAGVVREPDTHYNFNIVPDFSTPEWAKGAVMYQIFVDRFNNGDVSNDVIDDEYQYVGKSSKQIKDWDKIPAADGIREFYGGDLQGVIDKLDYLEELGIDAIYLNPIFVSPSNHKYDTQDYDNIDPHFGKIVVDNGKVLEKDAINNEKASKYITRTTNRLNLEASNKLFAKLVEEAHKLDIKVILDGVFNHCGSFSKWMDREKFYANGEDYEIGAYTSDKSPYKDFFNFYDKKAWPDNPNYDGWWGYDTLPKLNFEGSKKLYKYILDIGKKWVSPPYNADGWRLDVAADLGYTEEFNHKFWRDFRDAIKTGNPDALILAEHYGDPGDWIRDGDQWDTVMNYDAFMQPVTWFLTGMEKHSDEFREDLLGNAGAFFGAMTYNMSKFHVQSLQVAMNELSNHDHSRFLTRTNHRVGRTHTAGTESASEGINYGIMKEAVVIQMTWPGAPTIYYGDEVGVCGWTDPDNRRTFPWGSENIELLELHKELIALRNRKPVLKTGSIKFLYSGHEVIGYGRFDEKDKMVILCNNSSEVKKIQVPVWEIGIENNENCYQIFRTTKEEMSIESKLVPLLDGEIEIELPPFSGTIIENRM